MSRFPRRIAAPVLLAALAGPCSTQAQVAPGPCAQAEHRQFDFWIGDWDVFLPDGKQAGANRIEPLYGCGLHERWDGGKLKGQSFNRYDAARGVWHQTWVDSGGTLLLLEGRFADGAMVLSDATVPGRREGAAVNEIRWSRNDDGTVRQLWRATKDGGKTWAVVFDGKYVRSTRPQPR